MEFQITLLGVTGANILTPGDSATSIMSLRMHTLGNDRMPPLGTKLVDPEGTAVIDSWINSLTACALDTVPPVTGGTGAFIQGGDGTVSMEMENFDLTIVGSDTSWTLVSDAGASDGMAMQAPGNGQPRLEYQVNFSQAGTHYVFVRAQGNSSSSNSMWLGFDGDLFMQNVNINPLNSWQWEGGYTITVPAPGEYTVTMVRRESNALGDKIVIKTSNTAPMGVGPAQSLRGGVGSNTAPAVAIMSPADGATFVSGDLVSFIGTADDIEDGDIAASLQWTSSLDGVIGTTAGFSISTLNVGNHVITAAVTDSGGLPGNDVISVTITDPSNTAPVVTITSPTSGSSVTDGDTVNFVGTASDAEDGDRTATLNWTSSIDGAIGMGGSFSTSSLSVGTHTITAEASDLLPQTGSSSILLTVDPLTGGTGAFIQGGDGTVSMEMENFDLTIVGSDTSWTLVSDAGASDGMAMQAPGNGQPRLEYQVNFSQAGTHYVFVRAQGNSSSSNSMWLGFDGDLFMQNVNINPLNSWQWEGGYTITVPAPGEYTVTMVRRESNALGDKIVIKTSNTAPMGVGPAQSLRAP